MSRQVHDALPLDPASIGHSQNRAELRRVGAAINLIATADFNMRRLRRRQRPHRLQVLPGANNCIECQQQSEQGVESIDREPIARAFLKRWDLPDGEAGA